MNQKDRTNIAVAYTCPYMKMINVIEYDQKMPHSSDHRAYYKRKRPRYVIQANYREYFYLGNNCIQNFHLGWSIVGCTVGNLVLRLRASGAVKRDFRTYIRRYTSQNEKGYVR